jgi:hydroxyacyl-ACP dehydratase HTD2-like protein with hotdog domain
MSGTKPPLSPAELDDWRRYVGRTATREQFLDVESLRRYAVAAGSSREEGYPNLVVQGPLTAARLHSFAEARPANPMTAFAFRIETPLFVNQAVRLQQNLRDHSVEAIRCDGIVAVSARAMF